ncbi:MAG: GGDEF domain-containing protein [Hyphomicrobiales bacterium]|nr:GGDEF domain-containing protein [Hyphomicrobiales bacterium]MCP5374125.1 GGDEF domain-containing protein [Hyphomicrobiales bacterium]
MDCNLLLPLVEDGTSHTDLVARVADLLRALEQDDGPRRRAAAARALRGAREAERRLAELLDQVGRLRDLALTDELTGLLNRRGFLAELQRTLAAAGRAGGDAVLVYIDLDGFKAVNDACGHAAGDAVLRHVAALLADNVRAGDCVGRLGGDEFAVLLTRDGDMDDGGARAQVARLDAVLNNAVVAHGGRTIRVRASLGTRRVAPQEHAEAILAGADDAMYRQKRDRGAALSAAV